MRSNAVTIEQYLNELPEERRASIEKVRQVVLQNIPEGVEEVMNWGMITYQVPLETYPDTYNGQPLMFAALASQKNHMAVYLSTIYSDDGKREKFEAAYKATGKRFDVGKSCVRFRKLADLPLDVIADAISSTSMEEFIRVVKKTDSLRKSRKKARAKE
jgi:uncharacterized protein YdhG (YjbR/CyaY superfamily)